jgi:hypothetical protein
MALTHKAPAPRIQVDDWQDNIVAADEHEIVSSLDDWVLPRRCQRSGRGCSVEEVEIAATKLQRDLSSIFGFVLNGAPFINDVAATIGTVGLHDSVTFS